VSYSQGSKVVASDFNGIISGTWASVWGTGTGNTGWGQTLPASVTTGSKITASGYWNLLVTQVNTGGNQTNSSIGSMTPVPTTGVTVAYLQNLNNNISTISGSRLNAYVQGSSSTTTATNDISTWNDYLQFQFTVTFPSADQARYFFNAGGQIGLNFSHPSTSHRLDAVISSICNYLGTLWLSSPISGTCTLAGTNYNGVTKIGGVGGYDTTYSNNGYYALTSTDSTLIIQKTNAGFAYIYYDTDTNLTITANSNGNVLTITCKFSEIPDGGTISTGTTATLTVRSPSTTYLSNTWGTPSVSYNITYNTVIVITKTYAVAGDFNNQLYTLDPTNGSAVLYGAHTTSGGNAGMPGLTYIQDYATSANLYQIDCQNSWFPLVITLANNYRLGSGDVSPAYNYSNVPQFLWRTYTSNWTDSMLNTEFGLTSGQAAASFRASQVWWEGAYGSEDDTLYYGLAILDSRNFNAGSPGSAWATCTIIPYYLNVDTGGEWSSHGFQYWPTTNGTSVTGQTDYTNFVKTGATSRDGGGVEGTLSDYTVTLDDYSLVIPVLKSDNGFSGGARDSNRNPLVVRFGYIGENDTGTAPTSGTVIFDTRYAPAVPSSNPSYFAVTNGSWGTFLNNHGIWGSDSVNFNATYPIPFPIRGTYQIELSTDNSGNVVIDGTTVLTSSNYSTSVTTTVSLTSGTHYIGVNGYNSGGAAGIGVLITFVST
jgi:hypothetical protein